MGEGEKQAALAELQGIPGVGQKIGEELWNLGCWSVRDLKGADPEDLYRRLCIQQGTQVDRCVLYVFRCAVYYASNDEHDPELLQWWHWKDGAGP